MRASFSNSAATRQVVRPGLVILLIAMAGCTEPEIDRPGTWKPTGANDQNLRVMLVNPQDEFYGTGATTSRGDSGARAVTRLLTDRRRPLLDASLSKTAPNAGGAADTPLSGGVAGGVAQ